MGRGGRHLPPGCAYSNKVVWSRILRLNPDIKRPELQTKYGMYEHGCGLDAVQMSWGHDEYLYHMLQAPPAAGRVLHDPLPQLLRVAPRTNTSTSATRRTTP